MDTVDVIIPVFGDTEPWRELRERAIDSAWTQTVLPNRIFCGYDEHELSAARNKPAFASTADWLIFLDADDELDRHYIEHMLEAEGDIRQPSTLGVVDGKRDDYPVLIPPGPSFMVHNHLIIGCMVRREMFVAVGGFRELPVLEDWDLWIRLQLHGAIVGAAPKSIYRVNVRLESRNTDVYTHAQVYRQIQSEYEREWITKGLR